MFFQNMTVCPAGEAMHYFGAFLKQREVVRIEQYRIPRELLSLILQETQSKHPTRLTPENPLNLLKTFDYPFQNKRQNWFQNSEMVQGSSGTPSTLRAGQCQSLKCMIHMKNTDEADHLEFRISQV